MPDRTHNVRSSLSVLVTVAALGAIAFVWLSLRNGESPVGVLPSTPAIEPPEQAPLASAPAPTEPPATVKLREIRAMSETYRNTTFLIAIRDSGFTCHDLLNVHGGVDDSMAWTAACSDMLAYTVRIATAGTLAVEPLATYFDSVAPGGVNQQQTLPVPETRQQAPIPRR